MFDTATGRFFKNWSDIIVETRRRETEWIKQLRADGIVAAHPDDGWVDRKENTVLLNYPYFRRTKIEIGDRLVLGRPDKFRVVEVVEIIESRFFSGITRYKFKEIQRGAEMK